MTFGQPLAPQSDDWREIVRLRDAAREAIEEVLREEEPDQSAASPEREL